MREKRGEEITRSNGKGPQHITEIKPNYQTQMNRRAEDLEPTRPLGLAIVIILLSILCSGGLVMLYLWISLY